MKYYTPTSAHLVVTKVQTCLGCADFVEDYEAGGLNEHREHESRPRSEEEAGRENQNGLREERGERMSNDAHEDGRRGDCGR